MRPPTPRLAALALAALVCLGTRCEPRPAEPRFLRDEQGRALILHGANVSGSAKGDPQRLPWVGPDDVSRLARDWGFDFARYLILWDALEPEPGVYGEAYLDAVAERLDWFHGAGIHVVLDMHQDVYSRKFCCDGAPLWAVRDDGIPFQQRPVWWTNYFTRAVTRAWDHFWAYTDGDHADLQDHFAAVWARVAERFRDHPAVLGYDILNEPYPGTLVSVAELGGSEDPDGPSPFFDSAFFHPFYARVIAAIREVDPDGWIFYEPRYGAPAGGTASYLPRLDDPRAGEDRLAYFPHFYSIAIETGGVYDPEADLAIPRWTANRSAEVDLQDAPLLIGEFGVVDGVQGGAQHLKEVLRMADRITSGWAYWEYNDDGFGFLNGDGSEKKAKLDVLVRAYAQRVAGTPRHQEWDPDTRVLVLAFEPDAGVSAATEIYVPAKRFYPDGFDLTVTPPAYEASWDPERELLSLHTRPEIAGYVVRIRPRAAVGARTAAPAGDRQG
jgi:endoglycosylceramidase